jgi:hypothetical protein
VRDHGDADAHVRLARGNIFSFQHEFLLSQSARFADNLKTFKRLITVQ